MKDMELLQYVHETAAMGVLGLQDLLPQAESSGMRQSLRSQIREYQDIAHSSAQLLQAKGAQPKDPGLMARLSSQAMATVKTLADSSDSKLAEMVIQGNNMGVTKGLKHLHDYRGNDPKIRALAEKLLAAEQANVSQMQPFL
ncbi:hypothetical protein [Evtepia sp.]|nr:hypothetical protein [Candidatus Evtepia faecavium]